jgi:hypothetical protein
MQPTTDPTRAASFRGLIALNALLLLVLAAVVLGARAQAQGARPRGDYISVSGAVPGTNAEVVWIIDGVSQELLGISYDYNSKKLVGVGYRNLANDSAATARR